MKRFFGLFKDSNNKGICQEISLSHQSFSGTDYRIATGDSKDKYDLGIVFPYDPDADVKNGITASSIIDHHNDDEHLIKHTELRVCNKIDNRLVYEELETSCIVVITDKANKPSVAMYNFFSGIDKTQLMYYEARKEIHIGNTQAALIEAYSSFPHVYLDIDSNLIKRKHHQFSEMTRLDSYEPTLWDNVDDEKLYELTDEWFDRFGVELSLAEIESYLTDYLKLDFKEQDRFGGFYEFAMMDFYGIDIKDEVDMDEFRKAFKYDKHSIKIASDKIRGYILNKESKNERNEIF